jgi:cob(I)alamin adenosyltransferase
MSKIYTKGDKGRTGIHGGTRVEKDDIALKPMAAGRAECRFGHRAVFAAAPS